MLDQRELRTNLAEIEARLAKRGHNFELDKFAQWDIEHRHLLQATQEIKANQNALTKQITAQRQQGQDTTSSNIKMKEMSAQAKELDKQARELEQKIHNLLSAIPNAPNPKVPMGTSEEENIVVRTVGDIPHFDFEPLPHYDIGTKLGILDFESAAKVTGSRFVFYRGLGAKLERSLVSLMLDTHTKNGYTEILPPVIVNSNSLFGTGQLPKFAHDVFKIADTDYYLAPTAEVPVTNIHKNEILDGAKLPIKYCAYSPCFRSEAGSAGRDTRGIIRQHQFHKVELVKFTKPEQSYNELESLLLSSEQILKILEIPYRVVLLCTGDLGFSSAITYDIEVWMPSYGRYVEISSCSNFEGFQARRANIRYKDNIKDKAKHVHTLNSSGLAVGRLFAAILENCQHNATIKLPKALIPYMGTEYIGG